jgi:fatty acyl-ACP thioesterase A
VRVISWFGEAGKLAARRDWVLWDDASGERLGAASSTWLPFSLDTRRMVRMPPEIKSWFATCSPQPPRWALGERFAPERCAELFAADVDSRGGNGGNGASSILSGSVSSSAPRRVRRCDLDMNRHANNAAYVAWILEDVPTRFCDEQFTSGLDMEFRAECGFGDAVRSRAALLRAATAADAGSGGAHGAGAGGEEEEVTWQHALARAGDGVELLRARTLWRPLPAAQRQPQP